MTVAIARVTLFLGESHSLKDKRMVLRKVKDLVRNKFNVSIAQVSEDDRWQRAVTDLKNEGLVKAFGISVNRWEPTSAFKAFRTGLIDGANNPNAVPPFGIPARIDSVTPLPAFRTVNQFIEAYCKPV